MSEEKKIITNDVGETEEKEISVDNLDEVSGGAFGNIPRVPTKKIDDNLKENI